MLTKQGGLCAICQRALTIDGNRRDRACLDHCHLTGRIRGILCAPCNSGLGMLQESAEVLERALHYLKQ